jgi:hypothetical protein
MGSATNNTKTNGNGNGHALARQSLAAQVPAVVEQLQEPPPWLKAMREAMTGSIGAEDVKEVMKKQVEKAKGGDMKAASFVMNQAHKLMDMQAKSRRPVTIVQNNYYDTPAEAGPVAPIEPGDAHGKDLLKMRSRARAGKPLTGLPGDRRAQPISDEEEKELRRREEAEDAE